MKQEILKFTQYENRKYNHLIYGSIMMAMEQDFMNGVDEMIATHQADGS